MNLTANLTMTLVLLFLMNNSINAQIKSDYDKETDFSKYTNYSFEGWQNNSDKLLNEFDKKRITDALKEEFDNRKMYYVVTNADARITLYVVLTNKTSTTAYTEYTGGLGYRPRWGWGRGAGMHSFETTYNEEDYIEGTLVVDMYDTKTNQLLWQGVLTSAISDNPDKREKNIPKKIKKLMAKFPKPVSK